MKRHMWINTAIAVVALAGVFVSLAIQLEACPPPVPASTDAAKT